jgi:hypothetical protein
MQKTKIEYVVALDDQVTIFHMQQPTKNMQAQWSKYTRAGATRGERAGGVTPLFLGGIRS